MKKVNLLFVSFVAILFFGCKNYAPEKYQIFTENSAKGIVEVDKTEAYLGEIVAVTVTAYEGYKVLGMKIKGDDYFTSCTYSTDLEDKHTFYYVVDRPQPVVQGIFDNSNKYKLVRNVCEHGSFTVNTPQAEVYEESEITITVTPEDKYHTKTVYYQYDSYPEPIIEILTPDSEGSDKYSFIMPSKNTDIFVEFQSDVYFAEKKNEVIKGENLIYKVVNLSLDSAGYDIYVNDKVVKSNVSLNDGAEIEVETSSLEEGFVEVYAKKGTYVTDSIESNIKYKSSDIPAGWNQIDLHVKNIEEEESYSTKKVKFTLYTNNPQNTYLKSKYYYESDVSNVRDNNKTYWTGGCLNVDIDFVYDKPDSIIYYIYDESNKVISGKVKIDIPCYTDFKEGADKSGELIKYTALGLKESELGDFVISEADKEYVDVRKETNGYSIKPKKLTGIPRKIIFKDNTGVSRSYCICYKVTYSGSIEKEIMPKCSVSSSNYTSQQKIVLKNTENDVSFYVYKGSSGRQYSWDEENVDIVITKENEEKDRQKSKIEGGECTYLKAPTNLASGDYKIHIEFNGIISAETDFEVK